MDVPTHLKAIVDAAVGREHSASGAVMRCLAEVLAVHEKDVLRAVAARQRHYRDHVDPECGMDALITLIDPDLEGTTLMSQPVIVRPTDSIDADEWSIITSRRQLIDTIRVWLGDIAPELLRDLTHGTTDIPGQIVDDLPGAVAELIDHIKRGVCTCDRFAGHHAPTCRTITG